MCGITGIVNTNGAPVLEQELQRFNNSQSHRGPDGSGTYIQGSTGLGHTRLAILDLEGGAQPLCNDDQSLHITFNGEIYNYKDLKHQLENKGHNFRTESDTEVVLLSYLEWGKNCLQRLRGMFAFGIWDVKKQELFLARDRIGIKPLCYYHSRDQFSFASEIRSFKYLQGFNSGIDLQAIDLYLHFQYIPAPYSIYTEVKKLPPAHYMVVGKKGVVQAPVRYWDIEFKPDHSISEAEWIERLDEALQETVKAHLVSDVPYGAFLSGGVDSSTVVGYMSQLLGKSVSTFTVGFNETGFDERPYAAEAAAVLKTSHLETLVGVESMSTLPKLVDHYGEPFADSSALCAYHVSQLASQHVKMVLSGDGGDEIFAGYDYYPKMTKNYPELKGRIRKSRRSMGNILRQLGLKAEVPSHTDGWYQLTNYFGEDARRKLWKNEYHHLLGQTGRWNSQQFEPAKNLDVMSQCQYVDIHNFVPFDNLNKMDIASMSHGLEVRVPLLDHIFLETVSRIPPEMKVKWRKSQDVQTKYIFKRTAEKFFKAEFLNRSKKGFSIPIDTWFAGPYKHEIRERLLSKESKLDDLFKMPSIDKMLKEQGKRNLHGWRLWSLLFLAEWNKQNSTYL